MSPSRKVICVSSFGLSFARSFLFPAPALLLYLYLSFVDTEKMSAEHGNVSAWLKLYGPTPDLVYAGNVTWPFPNIGVSAIYTVSKLYAAPFPTVLFWSGTIISALGIVLSALSIAAVWRKTFEEKNSFYGSMMVISVLDLIFNIGSLMNRAWRDALSANGSSSYAPLVLMNYGRGITYSISLISDLFVLVLSIERYLSASRPHLYHNLPGAKKRAIKLVVGIIITFCGSTRLYYAFTSDIAWSESLQKYTYVSSTFTSTTLEKFISTFADMVLPFISLVCILCVSCRLVLIMLKRAKVKKNKVAPAKASGYSRAKKTAEPSGSVPTGKGQQQTSAATESGSGAVILTLILDVLFIANQGSYCFYMIAMTLYYQLNMSFSCSYNELMYWYFVQVFGKYTAVLSTVAECLSHALNFLLYMIFSRGYRNEFVAFVNRMCG